MGNFMEIGLKKGEVVLCDHDPQWEENAEKTIRLLYEILGDAAIDIQHIGSTSVKCIKAKPVIDIIVGVKDFEHIRRFTPALEANGFYFIGFEGKERQPVYQCGEYDHVQKEMTLLTHYIHVVLFGSAGWHTYINVRDYLNSHPNEAKLYEQAKLESRRKNGESLRDYHADKEMFVAALIERANSWKKKARAL